MSAASATEFDTGSDLKVRWDNTVKYSTEIRVAGRDPRLLTDPNYDDGDRNFSPGIVSNRFDLLSQLDISKGAYGLDVSAAFWYDSVYWQKNDNNSPGTFNPFSVPHNRFTRETRALQGGDAEFVNGFVYGSATVGGLPLSFRLGRNALLWGESLFFPDNGIAGGQAPVDYIKVFSGPTSYARDVYMPVTQASGTLQLANNLTLEAYIQFEWRENRKAGTGSYFSSEDHLYAGGERYIFSPGQYFYKDKGDYPYDFGQLGAALRWTSGQVDYGLYALRFNAKSPQVYFQPGIDLTSSAVIDPSRVDPSIGKIGTYRTVYPEGIEIYGLSASGYIGDSSVAAEISGRRNMPLTSGEFLIQLPGRKANGSDHPLYAVGDTLHAQASSTTTFGRGTFWDSATFNAEVAASDRLQVTKNRAALDPATDAFAAMFRATFEPTYFGVLPSLDLSPVVGLGYDFIGNSSTDPYRKGGAGDFDLGLTTTYRVVWSGTLMYTHFIGRPDRQPLADRDFIHFSIERTF